MRALFFGSCLLAGLATAGGAAKKNSGSDAVTPNPKLKGYDSGGGAEKRLHVIPIEGTIDMGLASFVTRSLDDAQPEDIVILDVKTFGGRVDAAVVIRDALLEAQVPTVAFVHRAISAGALISLACDTIIMAPGSSIGAATPVQMAQGGEAKPTSEKVVSYMRAEMRGTAQAKGRRPDLAEAMVDADVEIKGVVEKGKVLTLTGEQALELKLAEASAGRLDNVVALLNLEKAERVERETDWGEKVARFLTDPVVSSLLMTLGFLGLMSELLSPGFGIGGIIGLVCLALFFLGQYAANLAGAEEIILVSVGVGLLALELLVIPGFGIAGIGGVVLVLLGLGLALVELEVPWDVAFELGYVSEALSVAIVRLAIVLVAVIGGGVVLFRFLPNARAASWLVFRAEGAAPGSSAGLGAEAEGGQLPRSMTHLQGSRGVAHTVLRPAGTGEFDGERVDVVTDGEYIDRGSAIEVVSVEGHRVVVRAVRESTPA